MGLKSQFVFIKAYVWNLKMYSVSTCIISDYLADSKLLILLVASLSR